MKRDSKTRLRKTQTAFLKTEPSAYGGELLKTRAGRMRGRPLSTRETIHLVLRSSQAKGAWSFRRSGNSKRIDQIVARFAFAYGVRVLSMANVGNHLHFQVKLSNRHTYNAFIRALTGSIAMAVTGRTRWSRVSTANGASVATRKLKFWDYRPFTRIVAGFAAFLKLKDYIRINALEGEGYRRKDARFMLKIEKEFEASG